MIENIQSMAAVSEAADAAGGGLADVFTVVDGLSYTPPAIMSDGLFGTMLVWSDNRNNGQLYLAISESSPAYQAQPINPEWSSPYTPAIAFSFESEGVFLAWTDRSDQIWFADSNNGWASRTAVPGAESNDGPALLHLAGVTYLAWRNAQANLCISVIGGPNNGQTHVTSTTINSRPTLCSDGDAIFALSGGALDGKGDRSMHIFLSTDQGQSFQDMTGQTMPCLGPPSMVVTRTMFCLAWADAETGVLCTAITPEYVAFDPTPHHYGCHGGGPAISTIHNPLNNTDVVQVGFTLGAVPTNPDSHHICVLGLPPVAGAADAGAIATEYWAKRLKAPGAPNRCPDPLTVWDPAAGECVSRSGCWGKCVLSSFTLVFGFPVFNPFKYALCVINCRG